MATELSHDSLLSSGSTARRGRGYVALESHGDRSGRDEASCIALPSGRTVWILRPAPSFWNLVGAQEAPCQLLVHRMCGAGRTLTGSGADDMTKCPTSTEREFHKMGDCFQTGVKLCRPRVISKREEELHRGPQQCVFTYRVRALHTGLRGWARFLSACRCVFLAQFVL